MWSKEDRMVMHRSICPFKVTWNPEALEKTVQKPVTCKQHIILLSNFTVQ